MLATSTTNLWIAVGTVGVFGMAILGVVWKVVVIVLQKELRPNGGSTFRDAMDARFNSLERRVEDRHRENKREFDRISERLERLEQK